MNKRCLAPAMASAVALMSSSAVLAESAINIYGNIDASVVTASGIGPNSERRWSLGEGNWAPSVWGFRVTEDLGNGMQAHVHLEGGFSSTSGAIANGGTGGIFSRMANVGIGGSLGSLSAGLNLSPFIAAYTSTVGLAGNNFYVPALLMHRDGKVTSGTIPAYTGGTDADPAFGTTGGFFIPNSLTYSLPRDSLGGLNASILYSFGGVPGANGENRFMAGNIGYQLGTVKLVAAASDRAAQYRQYLIGTSFPLGPVNLAANYVHFDPYVGDSSNTFVIGADMEVMPSTRLGINYAHNNSIGSPEIINLSAVYALSKNTKLYAAYNHATDGIPSSYSGNNDAAGNASLAQNGKSDAFMVGVQKGF